MPSEPVPADYRPPNTDPHAVKTGETLDSIARQHQLSWKGLAELNWKTSISSEVNWYLEHRVGCRQTTADGRNWVFDTEDAPGLIFVPKGSPKEPQQPAPGLELIRE